MKGEPDEPSNPFDSDDDISEINLQLGDKLDYF